MHIKSQSHTSPVLKHCIILDEEEDSHEQTGCNFLKKAEYGIHVISTQKSLGKLQNSSRICILMVSSDTVTHSYM